MHCILEGNEEQFCHEVVGFTSIIRNGMKTRVKEK
jgi:hypothetical protein